MTAEHGRLSSANHTTVAVANGEVGCMGEMFFQQRLASSTAPRGHGEVCVHRQPAASPSLPLDAKQGLKIVLLGTGSSTHRGAWRGPRLIPEEWY